MPSTSYYIRQWPVEFNITEKGEDYIDYPASYFYVKVKLTNADGTPISDKTPVSPVNLFLQALFSQVNVSLNERAISSSSNTYPYPAYTETLLNHWEEAKKSLLSCECFYKDKCLVTFEPALPANPCKTIYELNSKSKVLDRTGSLHRDIFKQNRILLNMVDMKIKMIWSKTSFCLMATQMADAKSDYKMVLHHASLFILKVKVSQCVSLGHGKALEKCDAKYPIVRVLYETYSILSRNLYFM